MKYTDTKYIINCKTYKIDPKRAYIAPLLTEPLLFGSPYDTKAIPQMLKDETILNKSQIRTSERSKGKHFIFIYFHRARRGSQT